MKLGRRQKLRNRRRARSLKVEQCESRRLFAADLLEVGVLYVEQDLGSDREGDTFELTFQGGAKGTQLQQLLVDGNQLGPQFGNGDVFFDTREQGLGADHAFPFTVLELEAEHPEARVVATVADGTTQLLLTFEHFMAGDRLRFAIDVDEVEYWDQAEQNTTLINEGFDPVTSGIEFQGSLMTASFQAPHYQSLEVAAEFRNRYDATLEQTQLALPEDDANGQRDRSAAAIGVGQQQIIPVSLEGSAYHDRNDNGRRDADEEGIADVAIQLLPVDTVEFQNPLTVFTDNTGHYRFENVMPGEYRIVENQPTGYLDGQESLGRVDGNLVGNVGPDLFENVVLAGGQHGEQFDFGELLPVALEGSVCLTTHEGPCETAEDRVGLPGVRVELQDDSGQIVAETETDESGRFSFSGLQPGTYRVIEHTPAGLFDGGESSGLLGEKKVGRVVRNDVVEVTLASSQVVTGIHFCEHPGSSLAGGVFHDANDDGVWQADEQPIGGVELRLTSANGGAWTAHTNEQGRFLFDALPAGQYELRETQPVGWLDGLDRVGLIDGTSNGQLFDDRISGIELGWGQQGTQYEFGELQAGGISGRVHADLDGDCELDANEQPLAGVLIELMDEQGRVIETQRTQQDGTYAFTDLAPGIYSIREQQPEGYFQGQTRIGSGGGLVTQADQIQQIIVGSGQLLVNYDFCEQPPASLAGVVHADLDGDCIQSEHEWGIAGVRIDLLDAQGRVVTTTQTDANGAYRFDGLAPGRYGIREHQPEGYFHGGQTPGSGGGVLLGDDLLGEILLAPGVDLVDYNFCEHPPASLGGTVFVAEGANCEVPAHFLQDVIIQLRDAKGNLVATTTTDAEGRYGFDGLAPGFYQVEQTQPQDWFDGSSHVGNGDGRSLDSNTLTDILLLPGHQLAGYDFCELAPSSLSGFVYQDGPTFRTLNGQLPVDAFQLRDGLRTADDSPIQGVTLQLRDGFTGEALDASIALPGYYDDGPIEVVTNSQGYYEFAGLPAGDYAVFQVHPVGYIDGIDHAGTTRGIPVNLGQTDNQVSVLQSAIAILSVPAQNDAILQIELPTATESVENNFSELRVAREVILPPLPERPQPVIPTYPPVILGDVPLPGNREFLPPRLIDFDPRYGSGDYTWHLSILNGGTPRLDQQARPRGAVQPVSLLSQQQWLQLRLDRGTFRVNVSSGEKEPESIQFGLPAAMPIVGDFNGDGLAEVGLFSKGEWFVDLNGNGRWDSEDLWAELGATGDLPVVGDWDGDGKDDIGIFGPHWQGDFDVIRRDPGLPDINNQVAARKNIPPHQEEAAQGERVLKQYAYGRPRTDVIDHVFAFGNAGSVPVAGDFNGDGIHCIGTFVLGRWMLDTDGDGRLTENDQVVQFGQPGDQPVVGDFDGDGIDQIGVFREGKWRIDDGNLKADAADIVFTHGDPGGIATTGDFDGDGKDDPAVYTGEH